MAMEMLFFNTSPAISYKEEALRGLLKTELRLCAENFRFGDRGYDFLIRCLTSYM